MRRSNIGKLHFEALRASLSGQAWGSTSGGRCHRARYLQPVATQSAAMAISAAIAGAQSPTAVAADAVGEIIVTARKRAENLQVIPESIQAISSETLLRAGLRGWRIRRSYQLSYVATAPGANKLISGVSRTQPFILFGYVGRHLSRRSAADAAEPDAGTALVDIERIEALAGPQGSL